MEPREEAMLGGAACAVGVELYKGRTATTTAQVLQICLSRHKSGMRPDRITHFD